MHTADINNCTFSNLLGGNAHTWPARDIFTGRRQQPSEAHPGHYPDVHREWNPGLFPQWNWRQERRLFNCVQQWKRIAPTRCREEAASAQEPVTWICLHNSQRRATKARCWRWALAVLARWRWTLRLIFVKLQQATHKVHTFFCAYSLLLQKACFKFQLWERSAEPQFKWTPKDKWKNTRGSQNDWFRS